MPMSIASEINRIKAAVTAIGDAIKTYGVDVPSGAKIDTLAASVLAIPKISVDTTLTVSGAAADAKVVGDKLAGKAASSHTHGTGSIVNDNSTYYAGGAGPIEAAQIMDMRANHLAFLPAAAITIEYSTDGGSTWTDYGATDDQKVSLVSMRKAVWFYAGKQTTSASTTAKNQLRITVAPTDRYCAVNMAYMWVMVAETTAVVDLACSTIGAKTTFANVRTDVPIAGCSGANVVRFNQRTFGGDSTQTSNAYAYRFTFRNLQNAKGYVAVSDLRMYGPSVWSAPNSMMNADHIYRWDNYQNVTFPKNVTAATFVGALTGKATSAGSADAVAWGNVTGKPSTFTPASHSHSYAGSASAGGSANSAVKLDTATAGKATQPVYFTGGKPTACTYTLGKSVPADAKFTDTNTWRGIQDNLTSDSATDSLSAKQGKVLDGNAVHLYTCTKSGTVYALTGSGAMGRCKIPTAFAAGDTFTVNGTAATAYMGADAVDELAAGRWYFFVVETSGSTVTINFKSGRVKASYTVSHRKQNVSGDGYTQDAAENFTGIKGKTVTPAVKSYTGFTAPSTQTVKIVKGLIVTYDYARNQYDWVCSHYTMNLDGKNYTYNSQTTGKAYFEASVTPDRKSFTGFSAPAGSALTIGTGSNTLSYYYSRNKYSWACNHYTMNTDGKNYSYNSQTTGTAYYGASVTPDRKSFTGFTAPGGSAMTIATSGNTKNYYYSRNKYTVTCIDKCGNKELGRSSWSAYYGTSVSGSAKGSSTSTSAYYTNYGYTGCSSATVGTGGATVYRYFDQKVVGLSRTNFVQWGDYNYNGNGNQSYGSSVEYRSGCTIIWIVCREETQSKKFGAYTAIDVTNYSKISFKFNAITDVSNTANFYWAAHAPGANPYSNGVWWWTSYISSATNAQTLTVDVSAYKGTRYFFFACTGADSVWGQTWGRYELASITGYK